MRIGGLTVIDMRSRPRMGAPPPSGFRCAGGRARPLVRIPALLLVCSEARQRVRPLRVVVGVVQSVVRFAISAVFVGVSIKDCNDIKGLSPKFT